jgi:SAM-dependent methyltransferase
VNSQRVKSIYARRFSDDDLARKNAIWRVLCRDFFQRYVCPSDTVLDVGAGACEFINHIHCARKLALDLNIDTVRHASPDVHVIRGKSSAIGLLDSALVDVAFSSNFFEHLPSREELLVTLAEILRVLRPGGRLLVLQPNIRLVQGAYWDFFDHYLPLTDRSLAEALEIAGFELEEIRPRFLPYTTKSRLPQSPGLVSLYLKIPLAQQLLGKQAWAVAIRPTQGG